MPPTRTGKPLESQSKSKPRRHHNATPGSVPGVQKIKSSLRQTRRLLAKDTLAANVRTETERRLKSLQADLAQAEAAHKERTVAVRYHKVKFFERKKILRKINQSKRQLEKSPKNSDIQSRLLELRVDLNYILNYPKAEKYISLFPPETRNTNNATSEITAADQGKSKTDAGREGMRNRILERMKKGELDAEPELHMDDAEPKSKQVVESRISQAKAGDKNGGTRMKTVPDIHDDGFFDESSGSEMSEMGENSQATKLTFPVVCED